MATIWMECEVVDEGPARGDLVEAPALGDLVKAKAATDERLLEVEAKVAMLLPMGYQVTSAENNYGGINLSEAQLAALQEDENGLPRFWGEKWRRGKVTPDPGSAGWPPTGYYELENESDPDVCSYYEGVETLGTPSQTGTGGGDPRNGADLISDETVVSDSGGTVKVARTEVWGVPDGGGGYQFYWEIITEAGWQVERDCLDYRDEALEMLASVPWGGSKTKNDAGELVDGGIWGPGYGYGFWQITNYVGSVGTLGYSWRACRTKVYARDWRWKEYEWAVDGTLIRDGVWGAAQTPHYDFVTPMEFTPDSSLVAHEGPHLINP